MKWSFDNNSNQDEILSNTSFPGKTEITNLLTQKSDGETTVKSPFPILRILAGLGAAAFIAVRRK